MGNLRTRRTTTVSNSKKAWRNIFVALFVFSVGVGLSVTSIVAALSLPPASETGGSGWTRGTVRGLIPGGITDTSVDLGTPSPTSPPGSDTTVFPNLSGLNVPIIVNEEGPIRFFGDVTIDGLTEVKNGLINGPVIGASVTPTLSVTTGSNPTPTTLTCNTVQDMTKVNLGASYGAIDLTGITLSKGGSLAITEIQQIKVSSMSTLLATINNPTSDTTVASFDSPYRISAGARDILTVQVKLKSSLTTNSATLSFGVNAISTTGALVTGLSSPKVGNSFPVNKSGCADGSGGTSGGSTGGGSSAPTIGLMPSPLIFPGSGFATMTITLTSAALNTNTTAAETVSVRVVNADEPTNTFTLQLVEMGINSGIFSRDITTSFAATDASSRTLHVGLCNTAPTVQVSYPTSGAATAIASADIVCPTQPDLVVVSVVNSPTTIASGDAVTFTAVVRNNGSNTPTGSSWNSALLIDGTPLGGGQGTGPLEYGETETETWTWTATQGSHSVQVCSDQGNPGTLAESNNTNNCSTSTTINVSPKLTLDATSYTLGATDPTVNIMLRGESITGSSQTVKISSVADPAGVDVILRPPVPASSDYDYIGVVNLSALASDASRLQINSCGSDTVTAAYPLSGAAQGRDTATTQSQTLDFRVDSSWSQSGTLSSGADRTVLQFQTRSCTSPLTLTALRFTKTGTVLNSSITNFKLERLLTNGSWATVLNNPHALGSDGAILMSFPGNPQTISSSYITYRLRVTLATQAGLTLSFNIANRNDVGISQSNSAAVNLPVTGNTRTMAYEVLRRPIALFGSFIPTANASFIQTTYAAGGGGGSVPTPTHPVTVYDDLFVRGNSATEPGNLFVQGNIVLHGGIVSDGASVNVITDLNAGANLQVTGTAQILGNLSVAAVSSSGSITGNSIGAFYTMNGSSTSLTAGSKTTSVQCGTGDVLLSCTGMFYGTVTGTVYEGSAMSERQCQARGTQPAGSRTLQAQGVCFNPNGNSVSGHTGNIINL